MVLIFDSKASNQRFIFNFGLVGTSGKLKILNGCKYQEFTDNVRESQRFMVHDDTSQISARVAKVKDLGEVGLGHIRR